MGEVDAFRVEGYRCYFGSEDHIPEHYEILRRGAWVIRVFFIRTSNKNGLVFEYKSRWSGPGVTPAEEATFLRLTLRHKRRLRREWRAKVRLAVNGDPQ